MKTIDFAATRREFPTLERLTYLNSGSYGLLANSVRAAFDEYLESRVRRGADWESWVERAERVRRKTATLLHADSDEIAITASASAALNALASALPRDATRDRILVSTYEFPTSGQIWDAQRRRGANIVHVPENEDRTISAEAFEEEIDERVQLVVLSHVCYRHGGKIPDETIRRIADVAHANGAYVVLDCYQSVGAHEIDVRGLRVDFATGGMLKYMLGTAGIGFLYVRRKLTQLLTPLATGWFAQANMSAMDMFLNDPSPTAARFQAGTPPVPSCFAADAGLEIILNIGISQITQQIRETTAFAVEKLRQHGFVLATPLDGASLGPMIAIAGQDGNAAVSALLELDIVTSSRDNNVRAGFHFYNDRADVDRLIEGLHLCRKRGLLAEPAIQ